MLSFKNYLFLSESLDSPWVLTKTSELDHLINRIERPNKIHRVIYKISDAKPQYNGDYMLTHHFNGAYEIHHIDKKLSFTNGDVGNTTPNPRFISTVFFLINKLLEENASKPIRVVSTDKKYADHYRKLATMIGSWHNYVVGDIQPYQHGSFMFYIRKNLGTHPIHKIMVEEHNKKKLEEYA